MLRFLSQNEQIKIFPGFCGAAFRTLWTGIGPVMGATLGKSRQYSVDGFQGKSGYNLDLQGLYYLKIWWFGASL